MPSLVVPVACKLIREPARSLPNVKTRRKRGGETNITAPPSLGWQAAQNTLTHCTKHRGAHEVTNHTPGWRIGEQPFEKYREGKQSPRCPLIGAKIGLVRHFVGDSVGKSGVPPPRVVTGAVSD